MEQPYVSVCEDELLLSWFRDGQPHVFLTVTDDGFGYTIREGDRFRPGKFDKWADASKEIKAAVEAM